MLIIFRTTSSDIRAICRDPLPLTPNEADSPFGCILILDPPLPTGAFFEQSRFSKPEKSVFARGKFLLPHPLPKHSPFGEGYDSPAQCLLQYNCFEAIAI